MTVKFLLLNMNMNLFHLRFKTIVVIMGKKIEIVKKKKWDANDMNPAIKDVKEGVNIREAARRYGMSEGAIQRQRKLFAEGYEFVGSGRKQALNPEYECKLASCIHLLCKIASVLRNPTQWIWWKNLSKQITLVIPLRTVALKRIG